MPAAANHTNDSGKLDGPELELTSAPFLNATKPLTKTKLVSFIRAAANPTRMISTSYSIQLASTLVIRKKLLLNVSTTWSCLFHTAQPRKMWMKQETGSTVKDPFMLLPVGRTPVYTMTMESIWQPRLVIP
jgi:hypothetical protein